MTPFLLILMVAAAVALAWGGVYLLGFVEVTVSTTPELIEWLREHDAETWGRSGGGVVRWE